MNTCGRRERAGRESGHKREDGKIFNAHPGVKNETSQPVEDGCDMGNLRGRLA